MYTAIIERMIRGYCTTKEAAERTGISVDHIRRLLEDGNVQGFKVQRDWRRDQQFVRSLEDQ